GWVPTGAAAHDAEGETHLVAGDNAELLDIERLRHVVVLEEQVPRPLVILQTFGLQGRRQVEHHNIRRMQGEDRWHVMAPNGGGPRLKQGTNLSCGGLVRRHYRFLTCGCAQLRFLKASREFVKALAPTPAEVVSTNRCVEARLMEVHSRAETHRGEGHRHE